jgi:hypothetical protein
MILATFDKGWETKYPVKQLEQEILSTFLDKLKISSRRAIVINSTWYTDEYHLTVLDYLKNNTIDCVVLVAMIDFPIPQANWFKDFNVEVIGIGYYPGLGQVDFWSLFMADKFVIPELFFQERHCNIDRPFMCLNRKPHHHRKKLYQQLCSRNLNTKGLVSMGSDNSHAVQALDNHIPLNNLAPNADLSYHGIPNDISTLGDIDNWSRHFLNIVTETVFDINQTNFVSEKIYKPILGMRPFLVYDTDGATKWLTQRGFHTYVDDFKDICDLDLDLPDNIAPFLSVLCEQPDSYWEKKLLDLEEKIQYNKQQFYRYVNRQKSIIQKGIVCPI